MTRASIVLLPVLALALVLGCPKQQPDASDAAPAVTASASASASASSAAWPKTVVVDEPEATVDAEGDELDGALLDADAGDADAADGDADAKPKPDAYDDAPLMGAKTYPDENPVKGIRKITSGAAKVHKAPKDKNIIATLPKGTEVSLVAEIFDWYRVRYTDPNTGIRRQGWVYVINFAGPRTKTCPPGWTHHDQDGGWCDRECTKNTDCKALKGYKCSGSSCFYAGD